MRIIKEITSTGHDAQWWVKGKRRWARWWGHETPVTRPYGTPGSQYRVPRQRSPSLCLFQHLQKRSV